MTLAYIDGQILDEREAKIPLLDRSFLFGDGVFTNLLIDEGKIFFWEDHVKRLKEHARFINIEPPEISIDPIKKLAMANEAEKGSWHLKIILTGGIQEDLYLPPRKGELIMRMQKILPKPKDEIKLTIFPEEVEYPLAKIKPISYMLRFWMKEYAIEHQCDDCLAKDKNGHLLEASFANIFWVHEGSLFYPDPSLPYLQGITLQKILQAAEKVGLKVQKGKFREEHLKDSCLFLSSAVMGMEPVSYLDALKMPRDRSIEESLLKAYQNLAEKHQTLVAN